MHYNISLRVAKKLLFFIKKIIQCGDKDEAGISSPITITTVTVISPSTNTALASSGNVESGN